MCTNTRPLHLQLSSSIMCAIMQKQKFQNKCAQIPNKMHKCALIPTCFSVKVHHTIVCTASAINVQKHLMCGCSQLYIYISHDFHCKFRNVHQYLTILCTNILPLCAQMCAITQPGALSPIEFPSLQSGMYIRVYAML